MSLLLLASTIIAGAVPPEVSACQTVVSGRLSSPIYDMIPRECVAARRLSAGCELYIRLARNLSRKNVTAHKNMNVDWLELRHIQCLTPIKICGKSRKAGWAA